MTPVFGSTGLGLGTEYVGRVAAGTPETRVTSVEIVGLFTSKWTFDNPIEYTEATVPFAKVGEVNTDLVPDTVGADYVYFTHSDTIVDEPTWTLFDVPAELTSPGRTVPFPQSGSVVNNKVLVVSVNVVSGGGGFDDALKADWVFDHTVTATDVPFDLTVQGNSPSAVAQVNETTLRCLYPEPTGGQEWSAGGTTNLTLEADYYLYPGQLGTVS
jgi:hypothetical protein